MCWYSCPLGDTAILPSAQTNNFVSKRIKAEGILIYLCANFACVNESWWIVCIERICRLSYTTSSTDITTTTTTIATRTAISTTQNFFVIKLASFSLPRISSLFLLVTPVPHMMYECVNMNAHKQNRKCSRSQISFSSHLIYNIYLRMKSTFVSAPKTIICTRINVIFAI